MDWLERKFKLREAGTTVRQEAVAGTTTFLTMSYIIFVNPVILGAAGMDAGSVMVATCLASAIATVLMGLLANYPIACAPGMGHNAFFAFVVCGAVAGGGLGYTWQQALAANLISGCLFVFIVAVGLGPRVVDAVPESLKHAVAVGIGLLIALVGLEWAGFVKASPATIVAMGNLTARPALVATIGFLTMASLTALRVRGAIIIGLLVSLAAAWMANIVQFQGFFAPPPSLKPTLVQFDFSGVFNTGLGLLSVIFVFFFLDVFDTVGTLIGVGTQAGLMRNGNLPKAKQALLSDGLGTIAGTALGTTTVTSYIESAAGVAAGGRTGLSNLFTALLFLMGIFSKPLVDMMSAEVVAADYVTMHPIIAPALVMVGSFMMTGVQRIKWEDHTESIPAFLTVVVMPVTFSITEGIAFGFISYAVLKLVTGRYREGHWLVYLFAMLFVLRYAFLGAQ